MKVCIDIQAAIAQRAGVGRYTKLLVEHLGPLSGSDELALFYFDFKRNGSPFPVSNATERVVRWIPGRYVQQAWKRIGWPPFDAFSGEADLYHFPNFVRPPLRKGKSVVTIHDVSFLRHAETMEAKNYAFLSSQIQQTVERSDAIITDSRFVADEIHELLKVPRERLFPIHLGLSKLAASTFEALAAFKTAFNLDRPYLLHVGTIEPRKNHLFLIELFEQLDFDGELVLAGMKGWKCEPIFERIKASPAADRIRYIDYIPDEHLADLYSGAEALVFPSLYEGFGFPPLEAMLCRTPVIASTAGSLAEVLGAGARMVKGYKLDAWKAAVDEVLRDPAPWIEAGSEKAAVYNWENTAAETWKLYRQVAG